MKGEKQNMKQYSELKEKLESAESILAHWSDFPWLEKGFALPNTGEKIYFNVKFSDWEISYQDVLNSDLSRVEQTDPECLGHKLGVKELSFSGPYWEVGLGEEISSDRVSYDRINSLEKHFRGILKNLEGVSEDLTKKMYLDKGAVSLGTSGQVMLSPVESYTKQIEYAEALRKDSELVLSLISRRK